MDLKSVSKILGAVVLTVLAIAAFALVVKVSFAREIKRQEVVRAYNCQHYGVAINEFYGKELCPPTVNG